jgi:hypothetical protein
MESMTAFRWTVAEGGYRWTDKKTGDGRQRVLEAKAPGSHPPALSYNPLRDRPGLFRDFGLLNATETAIAEFADRNGLLGGVRPDTFSQIPEPFSLWAGQIRAMKAAIDLKELLRRKDAESLGSWIAWESDGAGNVFVYATWAGGKELISSSRVGVDILEQFPTGDLLGPARSFLESLVNRNVAERVQFRLRHHESGNASLASWPRNLLGALWLQFAEYHAGKELRWCVECTKCFAIRERARSDVQYCSVACRNRAYRKRQEQARALHAEGKTAKQIAQEIESDVKTVKRWISTWKGR